MPVSKLKTDHHFSLLLTCEHAGNRIPREYSLLFEGADAQLASHRGWDPGALKLTRRLSRKVGAPVHHVMWSRLLVESNRTPTNPNIWSRFTSKLSLQEKLQILETYWWPHRRAVDTSVKEAIKKGKTVLHIAVHSFTNNLDGTLRNADIGLLYDPARNNEKNICMQWANSMAQLEPELRVRRNYPYRGNNDGLTTWLRRKYPARSYIGLELEMNQALIGTPRFAGISNSLARSIRSLLDTYPLPSRPSH